MAAGVPHETDFVVVGGGAAGCVLAARLSEDPGCRVLLLEAGPELESAMVSTPGAALQFLGSDAVYGDVTVNQTAAAGRGIPLPTGYGLGGGSAVNTMTWFQGHPADYDGWRDQGADGWGWDDMLGIPVLADLAGVGANLHDHPMITPVWPVISGTTLLDAQDDASAAAYRLGRRGPLASVAQALAMLSLHDGEAPDLQVYFTLLGFEPGLVPMYRPAVTALTVLLTPASRGTVRLRTADAADAPAVDPAYLADEADLKALRRGLDQVRALFQAPALQAITGPALYPAPAADDSELDAFIGDSLVSIWHPVGTCRMGRSADTVVSPSLAVHGLQNLHVADASVMPTITRGNTQAPTIMIAEKAAALLAGQASG